MRTNFTIPDVHSIALGGGSIVRVSKVRTSVGPDSVGSSLDKEGIAFGGQTLTVGCIFFICSMLIIALFFKLLVWLDNHAELHKSSVQLHGACFWLSIRLR